MNRVILASASPRRRKLLEQIGIEYEVMVSGQDETCGTTVPEKMVQELALRKAADVWNKIADRVDGTTANTDEIIVIGADTVVSLEGRVMGKPKDEADACRMLSLLQGNIHQVYTGVALLFKRKDRSQVSHSFFEKTDVCMYPMTQREIEAYTATGEPMDKAGAYGIQGKCAAYIKSICGDYNNVVGLPVGRLYQELKAGGLL